MTNTPHLNLDYDAIVVGAGFSGIYMVHRLKNDLGLRVLGLERGDDVGGTWNWNRYPGAKSDTWSHVYRYSFDEDLLARTRLNRLYATQPEIFGYFEQTVESLGVRPDFRFGVDVLGAEFDDHSGTWTVATDSLGELRAKYFITAVGALSDPYAPDFAGIEEYAGKIVHTSHWPKDFTVADRKVGVVGTGSTGIQVITTIAPEVESLTVLQRTPQYVVPAGNREYTEDEQREILQDYPQLWERVRSSFAAFDFEETHRCVSDVDPAEAEKILEEAWTGGNGFRFMFGTFADIAVDPAANELAAAFVRRKIAEIVRDPETRRRLTPTGTYARRPACVDGYYETFNRPNVELVSLRETPIDRFTQRGIVTSDGTEHDFDVLIMATGFDAFEGNLVRIDPRGRGGISLRSAWSEAPTSYFGVATAGFPNMFMVYGPLTPFTNNPPAIEAMVDHIAEVIQAAERTDAETVEVERAAEHGWRDLCAGIADQFLLSKDESSFIVGGNIPGKTRCVRVYAGGLAGYREATAAESAGGFSSYSMRTRATS